MAKSLVVKLINGIEEYEQSALRSSVYYPSGFDCSLKTYAEMSPNSKLGEFVYCKKEDSLRLMRKPEHSKEKECSCCKAKEEFLIPISVQDMSGLVKYFGKNNLIRIMHVLDKWPLEGTFSYKNPLYLYLPEHKKLEGLFIDWNNMPEMDKFDELMDLRNYQRKRKDLLEVRDKFLENINKELKELEEGL